VRPTLLLALAVAFAGCGEGDEPADVAPKQRTRAAEMPAGAAQARAAVQAYLDALGRGDGEAACRLLSPAVISDSGDFPSRAACVRELSDARELGRFPIAGVQMRSPTEALVIVDATGASDTGFDNLPVTRHGDRRLLEGA
jgi:hypothetical protein